MEIIMSGRKLMRTVGAARTYLMHRFRSRLVCMTSVWIVALIACVSPAQPAGEYLLSPGDTLEISVISLPELHHRVVINLDGEISLPLIGNIKVSGNTLKEAQARIRGGFSTKILSRSTTDGRDNTVAIRADAIAVNILDYRPVYLSGDVGRPGEQPYRVGLSVGQAIAVAGGYDIARLKISNPVLETADLRSEYNMLWTSFAKEQIYISRLQAELEGKTSMSVVGLSEIPVSQSIVSELQRLEARRFSARNDDYQSEKSHLQKSIAQTEKHLGLLAEQRNAEEEGTRADAVELEKVTALLEKGTAVATRVSDARRAVLLSATRLLQTDAQIAQMEKEREVLSRRIEKVDDERNATIASELQEASTRLAQVRARLQSVGEKLFYMATVRSQLARGSNGKMVIHVSRKSTGGHERFAVDESFELLPGDLIDVAIQVDDPLSASTASKGPNEE